MSRLSAKNLLKSYNRRPVVCDVSLHVDAGEVVGLLGPNGAGKTTSFDMLVGLVKATAGRIFFDSQDITHLPMHRRAKMGVGYLAQESSIFSKLTVADNLRAVLQLQPALNNAAVNQSCAELLEEFNISHLQDHKAVALSGGERRRTEIARALACKPKFILLDEPFAGVDPISVSALQKIIAYLASRNIGVLITDHRVRATLEICDRAYIINEGKVIAQGESSAVVNDKNVREVYLGDDFSL